MARKRYAPEEIIGHLRAIEIEKGKGTAFPDTCRKLGITEQIYYRWKREYGGLRVDQAKRLKSLEQEKARLKKPEEDLSLDKAILKEVAEGNFSARLDSKRRSHHRAVTPRGPGEQSQACGVALAGRGLEGAQETAEAGTTMADGWLLRAEAAGVSQSCVVIRFCDGSYS